jgi:hypothetical protein
MYEIIFNYILNYEIVRFKVKNYKFILKKIYNIINFYIFKLIFFFYFF